jgi:hypothetical protein
MLLSLLWCCVLLLAAVCCHTFTMQSVSALQAVLLFHGYPFTLVPRSRPERLLQGYEYNVTEQSHAHTDEHTQWTALSQPSYNSER